MNTDRYVLALHTEIDRLRAELADTMASIARVRNLCASRAGDENVPRASVQACITRGALWMDDNDDSFVIEAMEAAIERVRELCTSPIDERVWSHEVYAAILHALDGAE